MHSKLDQRIHFKRKSKSELSNQKSRDYFVFSDEFNEANRGNFSRFIFVIWIQIASEVSEHEKRIRSKVKLRIV